MHAWTTRVRLEEAQVHACAHGLYPWRYEKGSTKRLGIPIPELFPPVESAHNWASIRTPKKTCLPPSRPYGKLRVHMCKYVLIIFCFLCSYVLCSHVLMCKYILMLGHTCCGIRMCGSMVVCAHQPCVFAHMDEDEAKLRFGRARPDPLISLVAISIATTEAMCDLSFLMFSCVYKCFMYFLMCDLSVFSFSPRGFYNQRGRPTRCYMVDEAGDRHVCALAFCEQGIAYMYV